jgi:CheY-like chemotaxis protein
LGDKMAKIMIVDDEEDIRVSVKSILEAKGYKVVLAENGDQCLQLVEKEKPDLILTDILMPGTPINEILPKLNKFKVIMFSVVTLDERKVSETGKKIPHSNDYPNVVGYIQKPFELKDLLSKIKNALG